MLKEPLHEGVTLFEKGLHHYARTLAFAGQGKNDKAKEEKKSLDQILADEEIDTTETDVLPEKSILHVADLELTAALARTRGNVPEMIQGYEAAVAAQGQTAQRLEPLRNKNQAERRRFKEAWEFADLPTPFPASG